MISYRIMQSWPAEPEKGEREVEARFEDWETAEDVRAALQRLIYNCRFRVQRVPKRPSSV
jgi:hypothetical protein